MALPKQSAPKYTCILPSDGREVTYRPFLVKEQKVLLLAQEDGDEKAMFNAVQELIESVTDGDVKSRDLAVIDMEYLFVKIRAKSVGETANIRVTCQDPNCDGSGQAVINLDDVEVVGEHPENKIMINDGLGVELRYPRISDVNKVQGLDSASQTIEMLKNSMVTIFDEEDVYTVADASTNDLNEFVESLTMGQLQKITEYFDAIPSLQKEVDSTCETCGSPIKTIVKGLNNFF